MILWNFTSLDLLQGDPFGEINLDAQVDGSGVEFMTQEEADKLLSSRWVLQSSVLKCTK